MKHQGFTLVELSIVLVIVGLIVGGIVGGGELIRQAELRAIINDFNNYKTAVNTFQLKYDSLPGDFDEASDYWPTEPGIADGDGDYALESPERQHAFNHLYLAKITNSYHTAVGYTTFPSDAYPRSDYREEGGYMLFTTKGNGTYNFHKATNFLLLSGPAGFGNCCEGGRYLRVEDAANIDKKIDDGHPDKGIVQSQNYGGASGLANACRSSGKYYLNNASEVKCIIAYIMD